MHTRAHKPSSMLNKRVSQDISARSPIANYDVPARQSLDSARFHRIPRSAMDRSFERQPPTAEEGFEDVGLDDSKQQQPPRKRGFFSKFADTPERESSSSPAMSRFLPGRKRAQSGQGAELGNMEQSRAHEGQEMH